MLRHEFETLEQNGITAVALPRIADPSVIPLWFGEGDAVTPDFIREAAKRALDDGLTFYNHPAGRADLREALKIYLDRLYGIDLAADRIVVPGSTMLGIFMAAGMALGDGGHGIIVCPAWPNIDRSFRITGGSFDFVRQRLEPDGWRLCTRRCGRTRRRSSSTAPATPPGGSCRARSRFGSSTSAANGES